MNNNKIFSDQIKNNLFTFDTLAKISTPNSPDLVIIRRIYSDHQITYDDKVQNEHGMGSIGRFFFNRSRSLYAFFCEQRVIAMTQTILRRFVSAQKKEFHKQISSELIQKSKVDGVESPWLKPDEIKEIVTQVISSKDFKSDSRVTVAKSKISEQVKKSIEKAKIPSEIFDRAFEKDDQKILEAPYWTKFHQLIKEHYADLDAQKAAIDAQNKKAQWISNHPQRCEEHYNAVRAKQAPVLELLKSYPKIVEEYDAAMNAALEALKGLNAEDSASIKNGYSNMENILKGIIEKRKGNLKVEITRKTAEKDTSIDIVLELKRALRVLHKSFLYKFANYLEKLAQFKLGIQPSELLKLANTPYDIGGSLKEKIQRFALLFKADDKCQTTINNELETIGKAFAANLEYLNSGSDIGTYKELEINVFIDRVFGLRFLGASRHDAVLIEFYREDAKKAIHHETFHEQIKLLHNTGDELLSKAGALMSELDTLNSELNILNIILDNHFPKDAGDSEPTQPYVEPPSDTDAETHAPESGPIISADSIELEETNSTQEASNAPKELVWKNLKDNQSLPAYIGDFRIIFGELVDRDRYIKDNIPKFAAAMAAFHPADQRAAAQQFYVEKWNELLKFQAFDADEAFSEMSKKKFIDKLYLWRAFLPEMPQIIDIWKSKDIPDYFELIKSLYPISATFGYIGWFILNLDKIDEVLKESLNKTLKNLGALSDTPEKKDLLLEDLDDLLKFLNTWMMAGLFQILESLQTTSKAINYLTSFIGAKPIQMDNALINFMLGVADKFMSTSGMSEQGKVQKDLVLHYLKGILANHNLTKLVLSLRHFRDFCVLYKKQIETGANEAKDQYELATVYNKFKDLLLEAILDMVNEMNNQPKEKEMMGIFATQLRNFTLDPKEPNRLYIIERQLFAPMLEALLGIRGLITDPKMPPKQIPFTLLTNKEYKEAMKKRNG